MQVDKKTVLITTPLYPPEIGGPATYTKALEREFGECGINYSTIKWSDTKWWPPGLRHLAYFVKVHEATHAADIVYAQDPLAVGMPSMLAARLLRKRFFVKVVGDRAWEEEQRRRPSAIDPLDFQSRRFGIGTEIRRVIERWVARRAERIIVPSEYLKKVVVLWGARPERIHVIQNGLPAITFPSRADARAALSIEDATPLVLSVGRLSPWKGFPALIDSFVRIRIRNPGAMLVIIGDGVGDERKVLEASIAAHGLEETVTLTGALPRDEVFRYLAACDVFILNTFYEGFSHQILEAMAAGAPVVTTNAGGNAEIIVDKENARLIPWNDQAAIAETILELLAHPDERTRLAANGRETARRYTEAKMVEAVIDLL